MAKLIKQVYDLVSLATDKGITGYHSNEQIMDAIHEGQMVFWRQLVKKFPQDKRVRNDLLPFEVRTAIAMSGGLDSAFGSLPDDFEQEIEGWIVNESIRRPLVFIESGFFLRRVSDPIDIPSLTNPIARIFFDEGRTIEVAPNTATSVLLAYFRKPVKPVFSTIESGGSYIYDDATSVDVEWSETLYDIIVRNALAPLGLNMRDGQVQAAGQIPEVKEATI